MPNEEVWTVELVQSVLNAHNRAYRTTYSTCERAESVFPQLRGQTNWDWVCGRGTTGYEAAVEVKRLTSQRAEETHSILTKIGRAISTEASDTLPGIFSLWVDLPFLDFRVGNPTRRKKLVAYLSRFVVENARRLDAAKTVRIRIEAGDHSWDVLPAGTWLVLYRHDPSKLKPHARELNYVEVKFGWSWFAATQGLSGDEFNAFGELISSANNQLAIAKRMGIRDAFLVLIEIGFSGASPRAVGNTLSRLPLPFYSNIDHIYLVGYPRAQRVGGAAS